MNNNEVLRPWVWAIVAVILAVLIAAAFNADHSIPQVNTTPEAGLYSFTATIEAVNYENDAVLCVDDKTGNLWEFYDDEADALQVGDKVVLLMDTRDTPAVEDDEVITFVEMH